MTADRADADRAPVLRVLAADATDEEVAALVAVLSSIGSGQARATRPVPEWNHPRRQVRITPPHGPGGWRATALPGGRGA